MSADLSALVFRCREADTALETAREYGDAYDRNQAQAARDAAHRRLGAEWREIAAVLEAVKRQGTDAAPESRP